MFAILNVIAPVFGLLAVGYVAVRFKLFPATGVDALVAFVNNFATPCLLFEAMLTADFKTAYNFAIITPFYVGALTSMFGGMFLAVRLFRTTKPEGVVAGFSAMFTNTVLVGIPIIQRAYGASAMPVVYSIITFHSTLLITGGMLIMELARREGTSVRKTLALAGLRVFKNPLLWGIGLGIAGNLVGLKLIEPAQAFVDMMSASVMPAALFGLGGALNEYKLSENWLQSLVMSLFKLVVHPLIAWVLIVPVLHVDPSIARYGVMLAAMPSGINAYVFATYYNRNINVAANSLLISTVLSLLTISFWLTFLG
jgi:malonate transporter